MDIYEIQRLRLRELIESRFGGIVKRCAESLEMKPPQIHRWLSTTSKDTPCAAPGGQELNIRNQRTDPYRQIESEIAAQRDINAARQIDRERESRRAQADIDQRYRDRQKERQADRCASYERQARNADTMSNVYRTAPYKDASRAEAQALRDRHFSECYSTR